MIERDPTQPADHDATVVWSPPPASPTDAPATLPVTVERRNGGSRLRWAIALLVTVLVVGVAPAAFFLLAGQTTPSKLLGYVPSDRVVYGEGRLDLPGDQRQKLGECLAKVPGVADQAT